MVQRPALLTASRPISIEARDAALMQLRISDRAALYAHPLPTEGGICPQQLLIALAVDHVLPRIPGLRDLTLADYRAVLHYNSWSRLLRVDHRGGHYRREESDPDRQAQCCVDDHHPRPPRLIILHSSLAISGAPG